MTNDLVIVDKIGKELEKPRAKTVFPLSPTHRKELRNLRDTNIGDLRDRLSTIKNLKREEYVKKYYKQIQKELDEKQKICESLNNDWKKLILKINLLIDERVELEKNTDLKYLNLDSCYSDLSRLEKAKSSRVYSIKEKVVSLKIARDEFDKIYNDKFNYVSKKIDDLHTKYEEAINFGDLEIVKKLYYIMKNSDSLFIKLKY